MLIFVHVAWKRQSEISQNAHRPPAFSGLNSPEDNSEIGIITFHENIALNHDYLVQSPSEENIQLRKAIPERKMVNSVQTYQNALTAVSAKK